jgi:hypothetical protein
MTKKLIALVEVLMVVSLFCTGFASWIISPYTDGNSKTQLGSVSSHAVEKRNLDYYGIGINNTGASDFRYAAVTTSSGTVNKFTNKTISVNITVNRSVMKTRMESSGGYSGDVLEINCAAKMATNSLFQQMASYGLQYPSDCKLVLGGYPNLFVIASVTLESDNTLNIRIPIEQIYHIANLDKINTATSTLSLQLVFTEIGAGVNSLNVADVCNNISISYTIHVEPK